MSKYILADSLFYAHLCNLFRGQFFHGGIRTYNLNRYDAEKQQALETWERKLQSIITGIKGNVISIEEGKKKAA